MSRIDELTRDLAPTGVPFKALGEVGEFIRGNGLQKSDLRSDGFPAIHYGQIHTFYGTWTTSTKSFTDAALAAKLRRAKPGDLIVATTSEDDAAVAKATAWIGEGEVAVSGDAYIYRHVLDPRYAAYFFQSKQFRDQKATHLTGTKVRRISGGSLAKILIPVPPLAVQQEIALMLDSFIELESELEEKLKSELKARRSQYAYHRHHLLSLPREAALEVPLGDLIRINFGARITKASDSGTLYPVYGGGGESFRTDSFNREDEWVISRFAMSENCVRRVSGQFWMLDSGFTFDAATPEVHKDYVGQALLNMQPTIYATSTQSAQKNIDIAGFKKLTISVPTLDDQQKILTVLEDIDAVITSLCLELQGEFKARRQQYEHYRDHLLTFAGMSE